MKLTNITPKQYRCGTVGTMCPAVFKLTDITSEQYRCPTADCPAVFTASDDKLVIIGKRCENSDIMHKVGSDEAAIEVDVDMIKQALKEESNV